MASIFTKNTEKMGIIEKYLFILKKTKDIDKKSDFYIKAVNLLEQVQSKQIQNPFVKDEVLVELIHNEMFNAEQINFEEFIENSKKVFKMVVNENESTYSDFIRIIFLYNGSDMTFSLPLYKTFSDKRLYFDIVSIIRSDPSLTNALTKIEAYIILASQYSPDEEALKYSAIAFMYGLKETTNIDKYMELKIKEVKERAGIYSVEESVVSGIDFKIQEFQRLAKTLDNLITAANEKIKALKTVPNSVQEEIESYKRSAIEAATSLVNDLTSTLRQKYQEYLQLEKNGLSNESAAIIRKINAVFEKCILDLENQSKVISSNTTIEIKRIQEEAHLYLDEIIKGLSKSQTDSKELLKLVSQELKPALEEAVAKTKEVDGLNVLLGQLGKDEGAVTFKGAPNIHIKPSNIILEPENLAPISPYFDETIPYKKRFQLLEEKIKKAIDNGEVFHDKFKEVLSSIIIGDNPYLIGPSGCGKTYMVMNIARLLELQLVEIGRLLDSSTLLGFESAMGTPVETNFMKCLKNGYIAFLDEFDNSNPSAAITLNSFSSSKKASYMFPGGNEIMTHPNFRIITAGNTSGVGANDVFNARAQIDESVQQRITPIYIGYDNRIEKYILTGYTNWYEFVNNFRKATDKYAQECQLECAPGIFTTRDATFLKTYLDTEAKTIEQIINCQFIQTKSVDYLRSLVNALDEIYYGESDAKSKKIYSLFKDRAEFIMERNGTRW